MAQQIKGKHGVYDFVSVEAKPFVPFHTEGENKGKPKDAIPGALVKFAVGSMQLTREIREGKGKKRTEKYASGTKISQLHRPCENQTTDGLRLHAINDLKIAVGDERIEVIE